MPTLLSNEELERYSRHFNLNEIGIVGQQKLKSARVLCVGAGGLGSPLLLYLAAAGVGTLGIVDDDVVSLSNLQRQVLYTTADLRQKKIISAKQRLIAQNPFITINTYDVRLNKETALELIQDYDIVADLTDNFATRYLINDACAHLKIPTVYASIFQFEGQLSVFNAGEGPCYRCLFPTPPPKGLIPNCEQGGVLGVLPGVMGTLQATEVIKWILQIGEPLIGRLLCFNALTTSFKQFEINRVEDCLCQRQQPFETLPHHDSGVCDMIQCITVSELNALRQQNADFILLDVRESFEYDICNIGGRLIPLGELPNRYIELDKDKLVVVHCKLGGRSASAVEFLKQHQFTNVKNLTGGIAAWIKEIDPTLSNY